MTEDERKEARKDAEHDALIIGGVLALLLGLRKGKHQISWDSTTARFKIDGKIVAIETIRKELLRIETAQAKKMAGYADALEAGEITIDEWKDRMRKTVSSTHILMAALAAGSISAVAENTTMERLNKIIDSQFIYLSRFAESIQIAKPSAPTVKARSKSYLLAAAITFSVIQQIIKVSVGYTEARRIRRASESCPGCIQFSYIWLPIEQMPAIGTLQCKWHCRCFLEYR